MAVAKNLRTFHCSRSLCFWLLFYLGFIQFNRVGWFLNPFTWKFPNSFRPGRGSQNLKFGVMIELYLTYRYIPLLTLSLQTVSTINQLAPLTFLLGSLVERGDMFKVKMNTALLPPGRRLLLRNNDRNQEAETGCVKLSSDHQETDVTAVNQSQTICLRISTGTSYELL